MVTPKISGNKVSPESHRSKPRGEEPNFELGTLPSRFSFTENINMGERNSAGKGDKYRSVDMNKYRENYDKIFAKKKKKNSNSKKEKKNDG
tara:strand:+ start:160 stop:432 length:273 start_codon:yes stop_codon:yes gene_type:complete